MLRVCWIVLFCALLLPLNLTAQTDVAGIRASLADGEFAPAVEAAKKLPGKQRDALLAEIAAKQAVTGAKRGSMSTLTNISDDTLRAETAGFLSKTPIGPAARGGGVQADFDTLIELMTSTIAPDSWLDNGGKGTVSGFPTGVLVDTKGVMSRLQKLNEASLPKISEKVMANSGNRNVHASTRLRKVSLTRLERAVQAEYARGRGPTNSMLNLAGLKRIQYVFVNESTGDLILAGPAGEWRTNSEGRSVAVEDNQAILQLDDFVVTLRNARESGKFGCAITPTRENLEAAQTFLAASAKKSLAPGKAARDEWVAGFRESLGLQEIEVHGIDPHSRAARVIVEADHHMKLVGMGIESGVAGVSSYLDSITLKPGESAPPMGVLRWWFTLGDGAIRATSAGDAFELTGNSVKVLSENELVTARGERIHTGKSDELNLQFAQSFTKHFEALAAKYPVYSELRNVFDFAVVAALLEKRGLMERVQWQASHFLNPAAYAIEQHAAPQKVASVANYRLINGRTLVAGASGGVEVDAAAKLQSDRFRKEDYGDLTAGKAQSLTKQPLEVWWWD
jgi:hypothetical protein